jgi:predicted NACHT family NTPase
VAEAGLEREVIDILSLIEKKQNFLLSGGAGSGKTYSLVSLLKKVSENAYGHFPRPSGPRSPARQGHIKRPVLRLAEPSFLRPANQCC